MAMQLMSEVKNDPDYHIVGEVFEKYINTPEAVMKLQTGQTNFKDEYLNTKAAFYRNLAKKSGDTLQSLIDKGAKKPPHMEQGETHNTPMQPADDEKRENMKRIKKAQKTGDLSSDQALQQIVNEFLPGVEDDPGFFAP